MRWASAVEGTHDAQRAVVDDVRVNHRCPNVLVPEQPEQCLDGADVRSGFEEVRGGACDRSRAGRSVPR